MSETTKFEQEVLEFFDTDTGAANYLFMYTTYAKMDEFARIGITDLPFSEMVHCESCGGAREMVKMFGLFFSLRKTAKLPTSFLRVAICRMMAVNMIRATL